MSDQGEKTCPLCAEEMDLTDQQLKPCKCGYEICVWCWHHIMDMAEKDETEGRCPACRTPYNKEKIVGMAASCEKIVADTSTEKRFTSRKGKSKTADSRKQLSSVRVIQRNLVYIVGLPLNLADEDLLQRKEYFAQYGEVLKVSISRTAAGSIQQFANNTCSVYITYSKEEEAVRCIQYVHGFVLDDRPLRACFGTTKYCHAWLRNTPCTNTECLYLHEIGSQEDSFTKDEIVSAFTRSRVQQITGATNSMQRRSGNVLPPPAEEYCNNSSDCAGIPISRTTRNNTATSVRCSPPNSSSGRSAALPAGALWGTRASNSHWTPANVPGSNGPLNQKAATCSPATLYTAVASTSQVLLQPADVGKKILHSKEIDSIQEKQKMETFEPVKQQHEGADSQTYMSENLRVPVLHASSMKSQLRNASSLKEKNKHVLTPTSTMNAFDRSVMSNEPVFSKDSNDATDVKIQNACYDMLSLSIDRHEKSQCSYIEQSRVPLPCQKVGESVSSADEICISREKSDLRMDTQTQGMQAAPPEMEDDLLSFDEQRHRDPEVIIEKSYSPNLSLSLHSLAQPRGHSPQLTSGVGPAKANMQVVDRRRDAIVQPSCIGSLPNGFSENVFSCVADLGTMKESYYNRMHGERLEGEASSVDHSMTVDTGESNIISNILSMDFDPWNESLTSPQNLAKLLGETDNHQGSLGVSNSRKVNNSNQSRFSFAREEHANPSTNSQHSLSYIEDSFDYRPHGHGLSNSRSYQLNSFGNQNGFSIANNEESNGFTNSYSHLSSNKLSVSRSQMSAPPGFSAQNRPPPPGFTSHERKEHNFDSHYGSQLLDTSSLCNQYQPPPAENVSNGDIDFMDPAILAVGKGRILNGFNLSSLEMSSRFPPQSNTSENDARLQVLMHRSPSVHENQRFADIGGNFSPFNDTYREQTLSNNISPYHQLAFPQHRNSNMSNGHWDGWSGVQNGNDLGGADFLQAERLGLNKFFTGYEDSKFRMPNSGDYYNRTFGI